MRLNLYLRGIDLIDLEFHVGSRGLYVDLNVFKPRVDDEEEKPLEQKADLSGTTAIDLERAPHETWGDDQPAVVRVRTGFQAGP